MSHQTNFKPRPRLLEKRERQADTAKVDRAENAKVKARSGGLCELKEWHGSQSGFGIAIRCERRALHIHHLMSGIGRRNVGNSIKAAAKLHVCEHCHAEIHGHVLKPMNEATRYDAAAVKYERVH